MMTIDRRTFTVALAGFAGLPALARAEPPLPTPDPILRMAQRGQSTVYLFGFAEAEDLSWFTPKVKGAFESCSEIWFETPGNAGQVPNDPNQEDKDEARLIAQLGYDRSHDLFRVLPADVAQRTLVRARKLSLKRETLAPMRIWQARETLNAAYVAAARKSAPMGVKPVWASGVVAEQARARHMTIKTEFSTQGDSIRLAAGMSDQAQTDDLLDLLDYIDDLERKVEQKPDFGWIYGRPSELTIQRMRTKRPALYQVMHVQRNRAWAERIDGMLATPGRRFIMIGNNHVLGPDSIQVRLAERGIQMQLV